MSKPVWSNTIVLSMLQSLPESNVLSTLHSYPLPRLRLSHMPANTISQNNGFVKAVAVIHSCVLLSTLIVLLAGSRTRELFRDLLATEPLAGSLAMTLLMWPSQFLLPVDMMEQAMKLLVSRLSRSLRLPKSFHAPRVYLPPINLKALRKL